MGREKKSITRTRKHEGERVGLQQQLETMRQLAVSVHLYDMESFVFEECLDRVCRRRYRYRRGRDASSIPTPKLKEMVE